MHRTNMMLSICLSLVWILLNGIDQIIEHPIIYISCISLTLLFNSYLRNVSSFKYLNLNSIIYFFWLIKEIYKSAFGVIKLIWQRPIQFQPGLKWINSNLNTEHGQIIYANSITLTPGTITVAIKERKILVHALDRTALDDLEKGYMSKKIKNIIC